MTKIDNFRIMHAAVGTVTTAKLIGDRFTGQKARERDLKIPGLEHPITISGELSDLEMLAEARAEAGMSRTRKAELPPSWAEHRPDSTKAARANG